MMGLAGGLERPTTGLLGEGDCGCEGADESERETRMTPMKLKGS